MCARLPLVTLILIGVCTAGGQPAPRGWRALFNGKNLEGWSGGDAHGTPGFTVADGAIRTQSGAPGCGPLWYSREKIANATLRVIYRMANSRGSSGIWIRMPDLGVLQGGIAVRIDDRGDDWHESGVLDSLARGLSRAMKMEGEWNTMDIAMQGSRTLVKLNGSMVTDYDDSQRRVPESGYIALGCPQGQAAIWFREISLR